MPESFTPGWVDIWSYLH